ncbi:MAG: hypothetical protein K6E92_06310 [Lachnospiraceae bacterium]|nr:hypothetical protein [Lachnospiraceae bacterium]
MIEPVRNNPYTQSPKQTSGAGRTQSVSGSASFSMEQALSEQAAAEDGVIYEHDPGAKEVTEQQAKGQQSKGAASVGTPAEGSPAGGPEYTPVEVPGVKELLGRLGTFLRGLLGRARVILGNIWESKPILPPDPDTGNSGAESTGDISPVSSSPRLSDGLPEDDFDRAIAALEAEEEGAPAARTPARSTGLLTYYDRHGKIVTPDPSVRQRVLHGDRGTRKS